MSSMSDLSVSISDVTPQLFIDADSTHEDRLAGYILSPNWVFEQKLDGIRMMVRIGWGRLDYIGAGGGILASTQVRPQAILEELARFATPGAFIVFDGEVISDHYHIFDMPLYYYPSDPDVITPDTPFRMRRAALESLSPSISSEHVHLVKQFTTPEGKLTLYRSAFEEGAEGIMMKQVDAAYHCAKRGGWGLKVKFVSTADCVVLDRDRGAKNALLGLYEPVPTPYTGISAYGTGTIVEMTMREIGWVTMIGKPDARPGQVVEVAYLYATKSRTLYQPRVMRIREDKTPEQCLIDQLRITNSKEVL